MRFLFYKQVTIQHRGIYERYLRAPCPGVGHNYPAGQAGLFPFNLQ